MAKSLKLILALLAVSLLAACGAKLKEIPEIDRLKADQLITKAQMENQLRNYVDAEKYLVEATKLNPNMPDYWLSLAFLRINHTNNKSGAKDAYQKTASVAELLFKKSPQDTDALMNQIRALLFLGRTDDARKVLEAARKAHPSDVTIKAIEDQKLIDQILAAPDFKKFVAS